MIQLHAEWMFVMEAMYLGHGSLVAREAEVI